MACLKLGSKSEVFHHDGQTWICSNGLPSDVIAAVGETSFHLHKFPLLSRSGLLESMIEEYPGEDENKCQLQLHDIPGGAKAFLLVAKFCYGVRIELTADNIVAVRCAAEYLKMNDKYGEKNLIVQAEEFLNEVFCSWTDSIRALETCEEVLANAEELHIVSRCINSLATKACQDPSLLSWPMPAQSASQSPKNATSWNGIRTEAKPHSMGEDWWCEDVSFLRLPLFKRLILAVGSIGMKPESIAGSLMHYANKHLPLLGRQSSVHGGHRPATGSGISAPSEAEQRTLLEEIVELLPEQKGVTTANFLLRLLRTSMILNASPSCRENLEKKIGAQLDQAALEDLLIPNMGYSAETLYDTDCVQRMLDFFMLEDKDTTDQSTCMPEEDQLVGSSHSLTPMTMVASLIDRYLAEVAPDVNLKLPKFQALAAVIPDFSRPLEDGIYRAIDIYLKAHPWLTESEKEQICRLMNCQKLSLDASTHAAQNERLPLRVIVQVLFFEQLRLRTSIAGWFFVSDNLENSHNPSGDITFNQQVPTQENIGGFTDMRERVAELEKECLSMKKELQKITKNKGGWKIFTRFGFRKKSKSSDKKTSKNVNSTAPAEATEPLLDRRENRYNSEQRELV